MRTVYCFLLVCCFLLTACTAKLKFPREEILAQALMPLRGIASPFRLEVKGPFLMVQNNNRQDSLFHTYSLRDYELKNVFGVMGRGPNEFVYPGLYGTQLPDVIIIDTHTDFMTYRFDLNEEGVAILKDAKQPKYIYGIGNVGFINDTLLVVDDSFISPSLHILSFCDELPQKSWQYGDPAIVNRFIDPDRGTVYANNDGIVFCRYFKKQIDFMDIDLNLINRVEFQHTPPAVTEKNQFEILVNYSAGYLGKRYFYALFRGASLNEYREVSFRGSVLEVFDLDGNPVIKYRFDGIAPDFFVVDEHAFTLYGGRYDGAPEDHLLVYKLKGLS